jgi:hypothetical protein
MVSSRRARNAPQKSGADSATKEKPFGQGQSAGCRRKFVSSEGRSASLPIIECTDRQGQSGLGLDAQRKAIADYLNGGAWELVGEFTEVESCKKSERPELARAMDACRKHKARLVIAKLDRLSRNLAFIARAP